MAGRLKAPREDEIVARDLEEFSDYVDDEQLRELLREAAMRIRLLSVQTI